MSFHLVKLENPKQPAAERGYCSVCGELLWPRIDTNAPFTHSEETWRKRHDQCVPKKTTSK